MKVQSIFFLFFINFFILISESNSQVFLSKSAAIDSVLKNNPPILAYQKQLERQEVLRKGSFILNKTDLWIDALAVGVQQYFNVPSVYYNQIKLQKENVKLAVKELEINKNLINRITETAYLELQNSLLKISQFKLQDSIFKAMC